MNTRFSGLPEVDPRTVYVRAILVADLPEAVQQEAEGRDVIYALCRPDGARLALVADRHMAFALAVQNDLAPVNVH